NPRTSAKKCTERSMSDTVIPTESTARTSALPAQVGAGTARASAKSPAARVLPIDSAPLVPAPCRRAGRSYGFDADGRGRVTRWIVRDRARREATCFIDRCARERHVPPIPRAAPTRADRPNGGTALAVPRRAAGGLRATVGGGHGAPPGRAHPPRALPRGDGRRDRRRRGAALHRARVPRLPGLRRARPGLRPRAMRRVPVRAPRAVLL